MIRCTLELLPGGIEDEPQHLGTIEISNDMYTSVMTEGRRGRYRAVLFKKRRSKIMNFTVVDNYPRNAYHPWELVRRILNQMYEQNGRI